MAISFNHLGLKPMFNKLFTHQQSFITHIYIMNFRKIIFLLSFFFCASICDAQDQLLIIAKEYLANKDYPKAGELYSKLFENNPQDRNITEGYIECLIGNKDFKLAEKTVKALLKKNKQDAEYSLVLSKVYAAQGEDKKAKKIIAELVQSNVADEGSLRRVANLLIQNNFVDDAIEMYELGKKQSGQPFIFAEELSVLYDRKGNFEKATESLLDLASQQPNRIEDVKTALLKIFTQADKVELVRKKMIARINEQPENIVYPDVLSWLYIQQKDYESAFVQVKALDIRLKEQGRRPMNFARIAAKEKEYAAAREAYNYVIDMGKEAPYFMAAHADKISLAKTQLEAKPNYEDADVQKVLADYDTFFSINPSARFAEPQREYAMLLARYANQPKQAIAALEKITTLSSGNPTFRGRCKLDLGDYYIIDNNNWEATLLYSQVDKDFKVDMLGEEARFKNAKLSYYIGDFAWAQGQLDILKASTSELIANDALNLSVLITENSGLDSNLAPLQTFSRADLLLFQNKNTLASKTLDSITALYPEHALLDDILMAKAGIEVKQHKYKEALYFLEEVFTKYKEDILADDALFQAANINEKYLDNHEEAKKLFEKIILDYPGSSFVTEARKEYRRLRGDVLN
jgi:thioredoxin-like negative regulator of GroEL